MIGTVPSEVPEPDEVSSYSLDADLSGNMLDNWPDQRDGEMRGEEESYVKHSTERG